MQLGIKKASLLDPRLQSSYSTIKTEGTLNLVGNRELPYVRAGKRSQLRAYSVSIPTFNTSPLFSESLKKNLRVHTGSRVVMEVFLTLSPVPGELLG